MFRNFMFGHNGARFGFMSAEFALVRRFSGVNPLVLDQPMSDGERLSAVFTRVFLFGVNEAHVLLELPRGPEVFAADDADHWARAVMGRLAMTPQTAYGCVTLTAILTRELFFDAVVNVTFVILERFGEFEDAFAFVTRMNQLDGSDLSDALVVS